jgi:hypothetical protein
MMPHRDQAPRDDATGVPQAERQTSADDRPLEVSHAQMNAAHDNGEAVPFAQSVPWLVRYDDSWWVVYERGWLRVTDEPTAADLDQRSAQMTEAEWEKGSAPVRSIGAGQSPSSAADVSSRPPTHS